MSNACMCHSLMELVAQLILDVAQNDFKDMLGNMVDIRHAWDTVKILHASYRQHCCCLLCTFKVLHTGLMCLRERN